MTDEIFNIHVLTRQKIAGFLEYLKPEQLADIPYGFRNNIWWNVIHVIVTQQLLTCYLTENEMLIDMHWVQNFKKGTVPDGSYPTEEEIYFINNLLISSQQQLQLDYNAGKLHKEISYSTSYGFRLNSIEDALLFNLMHENMHLGTITAMKKLV